MFDEKSTSTFGERLIKALELQGITDRKQQVEKVAQVAGVTLVTARKYLHATSCPAFLYRSTSALHTLAEALEADSKWLFNGSGHTLEIMQIIKAFRSLTGWEGNKYLRYGIRLLNDDAKAMHLTEMFDAGKISRHQFLAGM